MQLKTVHYTDCILYRFVYKGVRMLRGGVGTPPAGAGQAWHLQGGGAAMASPRGTQVLGSGAGRRWLWHGSRGSSPSVAWGLRRLMVWLKRLSGGLLSPRPYRFAVEGGSSSPGFRNPKGLGGGGLTPLGSRRFCRLTVSLNRWRGDLTELNASNRASGRKTPVKPACGRVLCTARC